MYSRTAWGAPNLSFYVYVVQIQIKISTRLCTKPRSHVNLKSGAVGVEEATAP